MKAYDLRNVPFPDCALRGCEAIELLGVEECPNVCPWKFPPDEAKKGGFMELAELAKVQKIAVSPHKQLVDELMELVAKGAGNDSVPLIWIKREILKRMEG